MSGSHPNPGFHRLRYSLAIVSVTAVLMLLILIVILLFVLVDYSLGRNAWRDGADSFFCILYYDNEETVFSPGYSPKAWTMIHLGQPKSEVLRILGPPLRISREPGGDEVLDYSLQGPRNTNYRQRTLLLDAKGIVAEKVDGFYID